jgi:phospholipid-binding lipoprotein MlaA
MLNEKSKKLLIHALCIFLTVALTACTPNRYTVNQDPFEGYNRKIFKFNQGVDKVVYRPLAIAYNTVTPKPIHHGISNFYSNLDDVTVVANDLLQLNFYWMASDTGRLLINTTAGIGGLFDVAKHANLNKHKQDFGLTLARWGVRQSPYFLVPFMGIGTLRDQVAFFINYQFLTVYPYIDNDVIRYSLYGLSLIDLRASYLPTDKLVKDAFDPYIFVRDAYLQNRNRQIQRVLHPRQSEFEGTTDNFIAPTPSESAAGNNASH